MTMGSMYQCFVLFSGVETSAVVIRNIGTYFPLSSGFLVTVTVRVFSVVGGREEDRITTADVSTPENTDKVIMLATNMDDFEYGDFEYKAIFTITGGADVKKFTLAGNRLTFKATAFEARFYHHQ
jgi:hypothetical protein